MPREPHSLFFERQPYEKRYNPKAQVNGLSCELIDNPVQIKKEGLWNCETRAWGSRTSSQSGDGTIG